MNSILLNDDVTLR